MYFKENLRLLRRINGVSQQQLADKFNYKSFTTIQKWEDGSAEPSMAKIQILADFFHVALDHFLNQDLSKEVVDKVEVPILGTVRTGPGIVAEQSIIGYEYVGEKEHIGGEYFYLNVVGDSMKNVRILEGDRVYVKKQNTIENGDIAVVLLEDGEATLKRVFFEKDKMILQPENDAYEPMVFTNKEVQDKHIMILGKLIHNKILF